MLRTDVHDHLVPWAAMTCRDVIELLTDHAERAVAPETHAAIEAHCATCTSCAAFRRSFALVPDVIRDHTDTEMPADARRRLRDFLASKMRES